MANHEANRPAVFFVGDKVKPTGGSDARGTVIAILSSPGFLGTGEQAIVEGGGMAGTFDLWALDLTHEGAAWFVDDAFGMQAGPVLTPGAPVRCSAKAWSTYRVRVGNELQTPRDMEVEDVVTPLAYREACRRQRPSSALPAPEAVAVCRWVVRDAFGNAVQGTGVFSLRVIELIDRRTVDGGIVGDVFKSWDGEAPKANAPAARAHWRHWRHHMGDVRIPKFMAEESRYAVEQALRGPLGMGPGITVDKQVYRRLLDLGKHVVSSIDTAMGKPAEQKPGEPKWRSGPAFWDWRVLVGIPAAILKDAERSLERLKDVNESEAQLVDGRVVVSLRKDLFETLRLVAENAVQQATGAELTPEADAARVVGNGPGLRSPGYVTTEDYRRYLDEMMRREPRQLDAEGNFAPREAVPVAPEAAGDAILWGQKVADRLKMAGLIEREHQLTSGILAVHEALDETSISGSDEEGLTVRVGYVLKELDRLEKVEAQAKLDAKKAKERKAWQQDSYNPVAKIHAIFDTLDRELGNRDEGLDTRAKYLVQSITQATKRCSEALAAQGKAEQELKSWHEVREAKEREHAEEAEREDSERSEVRRILEQIAVEVGLTGELSEDFCRADLTKRVAAVMGELETARQFQLAIAKHLHVYGGGGAIDENIINELVNVTGFAQEISEAIGLGWAGRLPHKSSLEMKVARAREYRDKADRVKEMEGREWYAVRLCQHVGLGHSVKEEQVSWALAFLGSRRGKPFSITLDPAGSVVSGKGAEFRIDVTCECGRNFKPVLQLGPGMVTTTTTKIEGKW